MRETHESHECEVRLAAGTERVLVGWVSGGLLSPKSHPTFWSVCSSSRRHCTSFFRYWSSFSFTRSNT